MAMVGSNTFGKRLVRLHIPLALYAIFLLFPFAWMLLVSVRPDQDLLRVELNPFIPRFARMTLDHYRYLFEETEFRALDHEHLRRDRRRDRRSRSSAAS